jgi:flagellar assembly factor FliW
VTVTAVDPITDALERAVTVPAALHFAEAVPGFPEERDFTVHAVDAAGVLYALRSTRTPGLRFVLTAPGAFFPDYAPDLVPGDLHALGVGGGDEVIVLVMVTVTHSIQDATANLLAPVIIDPRTGTAMQVVLADSLLPLRAPLLRPAG